MRPSKAAQHRRDSSQESPSGRQIHASGRTLLLAKIKIGALLTADAAATSRNRRWSSSEYRPLPSAMFNYIHAGRTFQSRANGIIKRHDLGGSGPKPGSFGDVQHDALRSPAETINKRVLPGSTGREPFRRAGTFQGLSVNVEFLMRQHSVQGVSNFRHRLHADKVSDKASDKERKINSSPNSKMSKLQSRASCPADCRAGCAVTSAFRAAVPGGKMPSSTAAKMAIATAASRR